MSESIDQNTENYKEKISIIQTDLKGFNTQVTEVDKEVDPVEWRLTNQIKDVKHDINVVKDDLTDYINVVKDDLTDYIREVKDDLTNDIQKVESDLKSEIQNVRSDLKSEIQNVRSDLKSEIQNVRSDLKSDMKEQQSSLKWFIGIFITAGVAVIGVVVTLITLFVK